MNEQQLEEARLNFLRADIAAAKNSNARYLSVRVDTVEKIVSDLAQYRAMFNRETLGDLMISEATGGNGPRHIFNEQGTCIRCGEDAEEWDAGCVEELLTLAAIDGVKAEQYHTAARKVAAYVHTLRRQLRDLYQLASGGIVADEELSAIGAIVQDFIEAEQDWDE